MYKATSELWKATVVEEKRFRQPMGSSAIRAFSGISTLSRNRAVSIRSSTPFMLPMGRGAVLGKGSELELECLRMSAGRKESRGGIGVRRVREDVVQTGQARRRKTDPARCFIELRAVS